MTVIVLTAGGSVGAVGAVSSALAGVATGSSVLGLMTQLGVGAAAGRTVSAAVAGSMSAGALIGAATSKTVVGAVAGASTAAVSSVLSASVLSAMSGPLGWVVLGVALPTPASATVAVTFDCWKPVLHDMSEEPSSGMLLRDVVLDPRIKDVTVTNNDAQSGFPEITMRNIWDETFSIEYVRMPSNQIAAHAVRSE